MDLVNRLSGIKVIYFDIDGTLAIPRFLYKGNFQIGMPEDNWHLLCMQSEDNPYRDCQTSSAVKKFMWFAKEHGVVMQCLTAESNSRAYFHKVDFILKNYSEFFDSYKCVDFVSNYEDKVKFLRYYAEVAQLYRNEIMLVDDNYEILLKAQDCNFSVIHISEFLNMK